MWARRPESRANKSTQAELNAGLPRLTLTGIKPLAFTAARKSERILARRLVEIPTATGLTAASRPLITGISSTMAAGSSPSRIATRFTADIRSRRRVAVSLPSRSRAVSTPARVTGPGRGVGVLCWRFLLMRFLLSGVSGLVPSGLGRTGGDGSGNSGISLSYRWRYYLIRVFPITNISLSYIDNCGLARCTSVFAVEGQKCPSSRPQRSG